MDEHIRPYLAALLVSSLAGIGEKLVVPRSLNIDTLNDTEFQEYLRDISSHTYDKYGAAAARATLPGLGPRRPDVGVLDTAALVALGNSISNVS